MDRGLLRRSWSSGHNSSLVRRYRSDGLISQFNRYSSIGHSVCWSWSWGRSLKIIIVFSTNLYFKGFLVFTVRGEGGQVNCLVKAINGSKGLWGRGMLDVGSMGLEGSVVL